MGILVVFLIIAAILALLSTRTAAHAFFPTEAAGRAARWVGLWLAAVGYVASLLLVAIAPARAADDAAPLFGIDLSPVVDLAIQLLAAALLAVGAWAVNWIARKFKLSADSEVRKTLQEALANGVAYGANKLREAGANLSTVETRYKIVAEAANYVSKRTPDALAYFKVSPEGLHDLITARLPPIEPPPSASDST